jgi:hypothetical protein
VQPSRLLLYGTLTFSDLFPVKKAWDVSDLTIRLTTFSNITFQILLAASTPKEVALNAWLKLCRLDVNDEIEKWARVREWSINRTLRSPAHADYTAPRFSADGRVALLRVDSGFQSELSALKAKSDNKLTRFYDSPSCYCNPMGRNTAQRKDYAHDHGTFLDPHTLEREPHVSFCNYSAQIPGSTPIRQRYRSHAEYPRVFGTCRMTRDVRVNLFTSTALSRH